MNFSEVGNNEAQLPLVDEKPSSSAIEYFAKCTDGMKCVC